MPPKFGAKGLNTKRGFEPLDKHEIQGWEAKKRSYNKRTAGLALPKIQMTTKKNPRSSKDKGISINGDVRDSTVIIGDNNTINKTTIIQKFFNIFKSDAETLEQRNRRILLGHVENAWIKGVLDASLHGAALLDLGIKQDPEAVTQYPWTLKKESTDETLPAETSMLEIFDSIGMGRSLLILGAPGSGKTTMLLELARGLIARAREDVTQPIPMVFNLASWTEKLSLTDWLAQELNNLYSVPRKTAPDWVKGNKLLLLLDGLDEVRQESRAKCVEAINEFRKQNGLTSLAVCSRSQDYADLSAKFAFEGAIEVQSLTQKQIAEFFDRFGKEMAGIKQVLKKDSALREMAETPLFLSIMIVAYQDKQDVEILTSQDTDAQRTHLFNNYIKRMFERSRAKTDRFRIQDLLQWLSWLANRMIQHKQAPYLIENMQPNWLENKKQILLHKIITGVSIGFAVGISVIFVPFTGMNGFGLFSGILGFGLLAGSLSVVVDGGEKIKMVDKINWSWKNAGSYLLIGVLTGFGIGTSLWLSSARKVIYPIDAILVLSLAFGLPAALLGGLSAQQLVESKTPGQRLRLSMNLAIIIFFSVGFLVSLIIGIVFGFSGWHLDGLIFGLILGLSVGIFAGLAAGWFGGLNNGGLATIRHYFLRLILYRNNLLPWRLIPFLEHCVDLIFLRRVGGGYIFVHRLLMEHFAEMYMEFPTSKGN